MCPCVKPKIVFELEINVTMYVCVDREELFFNITFVIDRSMSLIQVGIYGKILAIQSTSLSYKLNLFF